MKEIQTILIHVTRNPSDLSCFSLWFIAVSSRGSVWSVWSVVQWVPHSEPTAAMFSQWSSGLGPDFEHFCSWGGVGDPWDRQKWGERGWAWRWKGVLLNYDKVNLRDMLFVTDLNELKPQMISESLCRTVYFKEVPSMVSGVDLYHIIPGRYCCLELAPCGWPVIGLESQAVLLVSVLVVDNLMGTNGMTSDGVMIRSINMGYGI